MTKWTKPSTRALLHLDKQLGSSGKSAELPQARACEVTASTLQSIKVPILQIPPGPRGLKDWKLQGSIPKSRDPSSRDPSSRDRESLVSFTGCASAAELRQEIINTNEFRGRGRSHWIHLALPCRNVAFRGHQLG